MKAFLSALLIAVIYQSSRTAGEAMDPLAVAVCVAFGLGMVALGLWEWRRGRRGGLGRPLRRPAWVHARCGVMLALGGGVLVLTLLPLVGG